MAKTQTLKNFEFGNHTDKGRVRQANEDYMGYFECFNGDVFLVCDGMGGHVGGAMAAQLAVSSVREFLERKYFDDPADAIKEAIEYANLAIFNKSVQSPEYQGMGTTVVMLIIQGSKVWWGHVGDSRIYLNTFDGLNRLTNDHSFVQKLVDEGSITEEEALTHPRRNELTAALGVAPEVQVDVFTQGYTAVVGDVFLLCSDGLTNAVSDGEIEAVLSEKSVTQAKAIKLVDMANANGGPDNITVQLVTIIASPKAVEQAAATPPPSVENRQKTNPDLKKTNPIQEPVSKPQAEKNTKAEAAPQGGFKAFIKNKNVQFWGSAILFIIVMGSFALQLADIDFSDYNGEDMPASPAAVKPDTTKKDTVAAPAQQPAAQQPVAENPPAAAPVEASNGNDTTIIYKVQKGETLTGIAERFGQPKATIQSANGLSSETVQEGKGLKIKIKGMYKVKAGDTLYKIAKDNGTTREAIMKANPVLKKPEDIKVDQKLYIPL